MSSRIGMNTGLAGNVVSSISGQSVGLEGIEQQVTAARLASLNPLSYAMNPGSLILAPWSITIAASAATDLANVRASLEYLVQKLSQEITQQQQTSGSLTSADPGWFSSQNGPTATAPDEIGLFEREIQIIGNAADIGGKILILRDIIEATDKYLTLNPKLKIGIDIVLKGGKFIPWVGAGFSAIGLVTEWDSKNVWGNWRNGIGLAFDVASIAAIPLLVPPLTPAGAVIEGVLVFGGIAWDVMDVAWDAHDDGFWTWPWE